MFLLGLFAPFMLMYGFVIVWIGAILLIGGMYHIIRYFGLQQRFLRIEKKIDQKLRGKEIREKIRNYFRKRRNHK